MPKYISFNERNQPADVARLFQSYREAEAYGYYSLKALAKSGLFVPDAVKRYGQALVQTRWGQYQVYRKEQCVAQGPQATAKTDQETASYSIPRNTTTRHAPHTPFDVRSIPSDVIRKELQPKSQFERSRGSGASCQAYFPTNFQAHDWAIIKGVEEQTAIIFDQIIKFRHVHGQGADEFVSLSWAYGRELIGQRRFDRLMGLLLKGNILERTEVKEDDFGLGVWIPRGKGTGIAYGYRFTNPDYRRNYSKVTISSKAIEKRLRDLKDNVKYPVQKHLRRMLEELGVEMPEESRLLEIAESDRARADAVRDQILAIQQGEWFFSVDSARRIYSNLTSLKRGARKFLRVRGEAAWQVDMPCCHLLALAHQCLQAGVRTAAEFLHYCAEDFYQRLADEGGFTREEVKEAFTKRALNASNRHHYQRSEVMRFFRSRWKWIARYMWGQKANGKPTKDCPKPHNRLALSLQRWEANLVIFRICDRIRRERPSCWIATIHDAIACLEKDVPFVVEIVKQELKSLGITLAPGKLVGKPM